MKRATTSDLTERRTREGGKLMKLDKSKTEGKVRFPWTPKRKRKKQGIEEAKKQYSALTRIGRVSMIQVGPDEFRTPSRAERRHAKIRSRNKNTLSHLARKSRPMMGKRIIHVPITDVECHVRRAQRGIRQAEAEITAYEEATA
jgi:hypothetical protein